MRDEAATAEVRIAWSEGASDHDGALEVVRQGELKRFVEGATHGVRRRFVVDDLLRLSLATEDPSRLFDVDAVCLIDEIDAHLHPLWEERILGDLRRMFPRVQFIVTTHSEYVVAGLEPHEVSVLREEGA